MFSENDYKSETKYATNKNHTHTKSDTRPANILYELCQEHP